MASYSDPPYRLKANNDHDTFKHICMDYEPIDKLNDRARQVELYGKLKDASALALA